MNTPSRFSLAILAIGLLIFGAACQPKNENENTNDDSNVNAAVNQNRNTNDDEDEDDDTNVNRSSNTNSSDDDEDDDSNSNTNSSDDDDDDTSGALRLTKPERGETVESPFEVEGKSSAASVTINVKKSDGTTLFSIPATVRDGEYHVNVSFLFTNTTTGIVEVVENGGATVSTTITFKVESDDSEEADDDSNSNTNSSDDESDE